MTLRPLLPALLLALAAAAEPAPPRTILFGTDCDANRPAAARELLAECGFNAVRLTGGGYAWAIKDHAAWARTLAAKGIRSYLQLGSHYPSADYFPLKGAWLVDQAGRSGVEDRTSWAIRYDHSCWPQLSYAHQDFRERLERDFAAYLASFPPAASLAGVILHNEPGFHWLKDRVFDYGAPSVAAFRAWLPGRHGDIATLNRRWGSAFAGFASVEPPTRPDPVRPGAWLDWRRFQVEQIAEFMAWEAAFARRVRPDLARTTNLDGPLGNWYAIRCSDPEAHSRAMDVAGMDIYPTRWSGRAFVPFAIDQLLGVAAGRPAHVLECEVFGDRSEDWKEVPAARRADLLRAQLWTFYGHGADAVLLWGFSRCDAFTISDGEWNPRTLACRDVAHQLRMLDLGRFRRPPPAVALVADPDAHLLASALVPGALTGGSALDRELQGTHAALASAGIPCDVIQAAQLPAAAGRYRALVLPAMPLIDDATADLLRRFAAGGGTVLASAPFAARDRWGAPLAGSPACGLTRPAGEALGAAHLAGQAAGLPAALAADLAAAGVLPALRLERSGGDQPDAALLADGGDRLLVVTVQGDHGRAPAPASGVVVTVPGVHPRAVFAFPATATVGGRMRSGPQPLAAETAGDGCRIALGTVDGALPVLLTGGCAPLLALNLPASAAAGAAVELAATCHNPGPAALTATLALLATGHNAEVAVTVPPWSTTSVRLPVTAPAAGRLAVGAELRIAGGAAVRAIPVDLTVP